MGCLWDPGSLWEPAVSRPPRSPGCLVLLWPLLLSPGVLALHGDSSASEVVFLFTFELSPVGLWTHLLRLLWCSPSTWFLFDLSPAHSSSKWRQCSLALKVFLFWKLLPSATTRLPLSSQVFSVPILWLSAHVFLPSSDGLRCFWWWFHIVCNLFLFPNWLNKSFLDCFCCSSFVSYLFSYEKVEQFWNNLSQVFIFY